ncbi:hypothetical protein EJ05DRAFT_476070 [Pseudovirgaria hyperparasitica]|uniref:C2 domain protein n=1 Tax=Pseudovirgaria hyperparasitica TaxID=470096 RepID=A0A6A6W9P6_9PEZI|nr:uncharacterized protein EJ05DRAFT_476070 [Pseudovirgaria hyperparasitica]KAF2758754.1 hypothetical protein EJ05DRAFT_476070 [Pseudovirgaria hyperparasitica]
MSSGSRSGRPTIRQVESVRNDDAPPQPHRTSSYTSRKRVVEKNDAYLYALRVAYLTYLLKPRQKRIQHVAQPKAAQRSSTSVTDLVKDISLIKDSKSTKFPHKFMGELDKRIEGVLIGKEKMPEYADASVKRTFAVFLNEFKKPQFRKSMDKDRRVEDLLLIFFSSATKELQKGKEPGDDQWKLMVDRHVALFIRLVSSTLKHNDWTRERPELTSRLANMEKKLLMHDQDLSSQGTGPSTIEVEVPRSYQIKDMDMVRRVANVFDIPPSQVQADIDNHKTLWTEKAALQDLKLYQTNLSLHSKKTLNSDDFDLEDAYQVWKKAEIPDISQMMLALMQSDPTLAKSTPGGTVSQIKPSGVSGDPNWSDASRKMSDNTDASYVFDQPVDMSALNLQENGDGNDEGAYTFIPPDPRAYYRVCVREALTYDLLNADSEADGETMKLLSKESAELLNEIAVRWRIPHFSRIVLFLDVVKDKYISHECRADTLDVAFNYVKEPPVENKKNNRSSQIVSSAFFDRNRWTVTDFALMRRILSSIYDNLLRDLFEEMLKSFDKTASVELGQILYVIDNHIYEDSLFHKAKDDMEGFSRQLHEAIRGRAAETYSELLSKAIPNSKDEWEFYHVIELGKAVVKLLQKILKRWRRRRVIMGVDPAQILVEEMLPSFAGDARDLVARIMEVAQQNGKEVHIQDGFDLYKELVEVRRVHAEVLPGRQFDFHIEGILQDFVWRWIDNTDGQLVGWVENAVKNDNFQIQSNDPDNTPADERHSVSAVDIYRSFNASIQQIINLNWDDDLQYAKFMTAVSKSIGNGVHRYCEMLEQMFGREMDRLTPEQEAAATQTRQEKWLQLAKDTWAQKEKIEPFHFFPESLVKLNNIEYATLQLDRLEHEVNVDACASVIQKFAPPVQQRMPQSNKYVFTIKIIEAEDLKACDMNGLSDPYVVLGDEYQKRLAKTRIMYGNLNPRWDETIDITTTGPLNLIATIWDWDTMGDHDCVGRTSLKLDPSHFRDFMPREYWLDLDTQGRLLLRVSMEGERDDIQFYFGKAFRTLKRTERDMTRKITDKLSPYVSYCLSRRALRALLSRGLTMSGVASYFQRNRPQSVATGPTHAEVESALKPLFDYFDDNFGIMKNTLTDSAMVMVMTRLWKEVLATIESLLVPPLSDKLSVQRPLSQQELDIVYKWLQFIFEFFNAVDEETGISQGVPVDILKSPKYHELQTLNFFYFESTANLIRTSEGMASATAARQQAEAARAARLSAPAHLGHSFGGGVGLMGMPTRKHKTVMLSKNLGTMRKAKEEKRKEAQADPNDDMILRILRMRPEAERYLKDRSRQKERLAAAAAAEMIVRQSLVQGSGRIRGTT